MMEFTWLSLDEITLSTISITVALQHHTPDVI